MVGESWMDDGAIGRVFAALWPDCERMQAASTSHSLWNDFDDALPPLRHRRRCRTLFLFPQWQHFFFSSAHSHHTHSLGLDGSIFRAKGGDCLAMPVRCVYRTQRRHGASHYSCSGLAVQHERYPSHTKLRFSEHIAAEPTGKPGQAEDDACPGKAKNHSYTEFVL